MMRPLSILVAFAVAVTSAAASFAPTQASALPRVAPAAASEATPAGVTEVRHKRKLRRYWRHNRRGDGRHYRADHPQSMYHILNHPRYGSHHRYRHYDRSYRRYRHYDRGYYYRDRDDDDEVGAAVVAGIIGLAAGAIIAGQAHGGSSYHAVCARKYRSYDPRSGTYLGYDGYRHRCRY